MKFFYKNKFLVYELKAIFVKNKNVKNVFFDFSLIEGLFKLLLLYFLLFFCCCFCCCWCSSYSGRYENKNTLYPLFKNILPTLSVRIHLGCNLFCFILYVCVSVCVQLLFCSLMQQVPHRFENSFHICYAFKCLSYRILF